MSEPARILSLIPSATEIVAALGCADQLVGRSHECDYPASVLNLATCSGPRIDVEGSCAEIDAQVREVLGQALSVYWVDADRLKALKPDVIVTQAQCDVCAVSLNDLTGLVEDWTGARPNIVALSPLCLADVYRDIAAVGAALGRQAAADQVIAGMQARFDDLTARTADRPKPRVALIEWMDPLMTGGHWMPELIGFAGGISQLAAAGKPSPVIGWTALAENDPDLIVIVPCGFDIAHSRRELGVLTAQPLWGQLSAVRNNRVYLTDGHQYFNRPGPRLVESAEILAEIVHPGVVDFGHRGVGWIAIEQSIATPALVH